jgi:hypothetical protein
VNLPTAHTWNQMQKAYCQQIIAAALETRPTANHISVSADIWTNHGLKYAYQGVYVHFIDKDWEIRHILVDVQLCRDKTSQTNTYTLMDRLQELNLHRHVRYITADNGAGTNVQYAKSWLQERGLGENISSMGGIPCMSHSLQRAFGDFFTTLHVRPGVVDEVEAFSRFSAAFGHAEPLPASGSDWSDIIPMVSDFNVITM